MPMFKLTIKRIMIAFAVIGLILGGIVSWLRIPIINELVVQNHSGQTIDEIQIRFSTAEIATFKSLADKEWVAAKVDMAHHSGFIVSGSLSDGTKLSGTFAPLRYGHYYECAAFTIGRGGTIRFTHPDE